MKIIKSHFAYSKSQRNGVLLLVFIAIVLQGILLFSRNRNKNTYPVSIEDQKIQVELDSIFLLNKRVRYKIYPFNPNYLSDDKAYQLGMSIDEIDRLLAYRKSGGYINSSQEFQQITRVSDSLLNTIAFYFKFPDWIIKKQSTEKKHKAEKIVIKDINKVTLEDLVKVKGVGKKRAKSIIKYRSLLKGFTYDTQMKEVWGIPLDVLERLQKEYKVLSIPSIKKININKASAYELSKIVYIDYKLAKSIVEYREEVAEIQNLDELKIIRDFPHNKFNLISLYLHAY